MKKILFLATLTFVSCQKENKASDKIDAKKASKIASHIYNLTLNLSKTKNQIVR